MDSTDYTTESTENSYSSLSEESVDHFPCQLFARCQLTPIPLSDFSIPPPKTQKMRRQQQKQPSVLPSAFTNKSVRNWEETSQRAGKSWNPPAPHQGYNNRQRAEANKNYQCYQRKKEAQKESVAEFASTFKDKKKEQTQNVAESRHFSPQKLGVLNMCFILKEVGFIF